MGSLSLACPMCCGESFDNSQSLKYHLLSMTDNIYCPNCDQRSDSVAALIQHLDCCGQSDETKLIIPECEETRLERDGVDAERRANDLSSSFIATVSKDGTLIVGDPSAMDINEHAGIRVVESMETDGNNCGDEDNMENVQKTECLKSPNFEEIDRVKEIEDSVKDGTKCEEEENDSSLIGIEHLDERESIQELDEEGLLEVKREICEEESLYSCSSCGMSFNSVLEHIKEYHDGQEVVLEMAEQQIDDLPEEDNCTTESCSRLAEENCPADRQTGASESLPRQRQTMNTLRTEECVDSEGRLYTRKVVQIERFWDRAAAASQSQQQQQQPAKSGPMIEKFFSNVEGVKMRTKSPTSATASAQSSAPQRTYRCNKCLEQFAKLSDFRIHACLHGNNQCELCEQAFASAKALQVHSRIHQVEVDGGNGKNFICPTCATEFSSHKSLRLHSRMHAPVRARHVDAPEGTANGSFTCLECGKTLSESYRIAHMSLHTGETVTCSICNRKFDSSDSLAMRACFFSNFYPIEKWKTLSESYRIAHMSLHTGESVTCSICNRKFDSSDSLAMHAAVHTEVGQSQQQQQQQHQIMLIQKQDEFGGEAGQPGEAVADTLDLQKPYQCQHCGRRFTRPHEKVKHERIHTGEKPHACEVCGKTFRVSYCLTLHMRTHTGVRPYACQHCGKRFKASSVYNHHLLTHGDERAYTCPYCPKTFKTRVQLAGHKNSHTKPFRCTECSRPFASLYAARAHIQTHKKDNNLKFSCYICGASYGRAFALKDHLKIHAERDVAATPEAAREEEVTEAEDYLITEETDEFEDIEEIEREEKELVAVAAAVGVTSTSVIVGEQSK